MYNIIGNSTESSVLNGNLVIKGTINTQWKDNGIISPNLTNEVIIEIKIENGEVISYEISGNNILIDVSSGGINYSTAVVVKGSTTFNINEIIWNSI